MNPINGMFKLLHWPICRAYARHLGDRPADSLLRFLVSFQFWRVNHFWPNFLAPVRFSEKVWSLQLHERDPLLTLISDNYKVREYVARKVGKEYLVPIYWNGNKPEEIPFEELPIEFVIKTNHGCGFNIFVKDRTKISKKEILRKLNTWININFCNDTFLGISWGYKNIKPKIIIEYLLKDNDKAPIDYKFWCFSGRVEFITLHFDRFENHSTLCFDRDFQTGGLHFDLPVYRGEYKRPSNYKEMVDVAESLASGFDFMRVDLYNVCGKIYFGELTPYPGGVSAKFEPVSMDEYMGKQWKNK